MTLKCYLLALAIVYDLCYNYTIKKTYIKNKRQADKKMYRQSQVYLGTTAETAW